MKANRGPFWLMIVTALATLVCLGGAAGVASAQGANAAPSVQHNETLDPSKFDRPIDINNKWLPMRPGMRWIYEGTTIDDNGKTVPHRSEINITNLTKIIQGIRTVISYDLDYSNGKLVEAELAFFAQDNDSNVWHLGEYVEEYENSKFVKAPAWIPGFEGAQAGIMMKADPRPGSPSYSEGWGPAVGWTDRGVTHATGQKVSVPAGNYDNVLVIKETAESEINAAQFKYYAAGVGNVSVGWAGSGDKSKEVLELVKFQQLDGKALAAIDAKALKLEKSAYRKSKKAYAHTPPAEPR